MLVDFKIDGWLLVLALILEHLVDFERWVIQIEMFVAIGFFVITFGLLYCISGLGRKCQLLFQRGSRSNFFRRLGPFGCFI